MIARTGDFFVKRIDNGMQENEEVKNMIARIGEFVQENVSLAIFIFLIATVFSVALVRMIKSGRRMWEKIKITSEDYRKRYVTENRTLKVSYIDFLINEEITDDIERPHYASILTMLGILGTFWGISLALSDVDISKLGNIDEFKEQIKPVFNGMKTAFYTSFVGIFFSITYLVISKYFTFILRKRIESGFDEEWAEYEVETTEYFLRQQGDNVASQKKSAEILKEAGKSFKDSSDNLKGVIEQIGETISPKQLGKLITDGISDALKKEIKPVFKEISSALSVIPQIESSQKEISQSIKNFNDFVQGEFREIMKNTKDFVGETAEQLNENSKQIKEFSNSIKAFSVGIVKTKKIIENFIERSEQYLSEVFENIGNIQGDLENSLKTFKDVIHTQLLTFQDEFMKQVTEKVTNVFKEVENREEEIRNAILGGYSKFMEKLMEEQKKVFEEHLGKHSKSLAGTIDTFEKVFKKEYKNRVEMLDKSNDTTKRLENIVGTSTTLFETQKSELGEFARKSVKAFGEMEKSNKVFISNLSAIKQSLEKVGDAIGDEVKKTMIDHFQQYHDSQEKYMQTTDIHIQGILQQISSTTESLREKNEENK